MGDMACMFLRYCYCFEMLNARGLYTGGCGASFHYYIHGQKEIYINLKNK